ncbi:tRNA (adenosine(37)-N6)-threonylcarbamoyltransferase complex transferase subunit TsaD [Campylobacter geochelonis]|uniref:tRNA (adenosine(37)-N6)-threonylcarbamoyltransferase complex transferase subunit TsaD n=1 Tax=Campylobacter geochelonis TaxID=1780362 RepID=UPI00077087C0|nr:tRNA (adenosine(37)-N6)-threonylcarbamoyltransferase complex transferase subunit TsaD [Campylobacter geochelonis]CZE45932.1 DNA-binding/iron metalloprotein/AP endonuclease [Campylobacter geochelonis]
MILGIESSCDDSSLAIIDEKNLECKFYKKITQEEDHAKFGGVVPELAARLHTAALPKLLEEIKPYFNSLKAVAVTNEPGLSVSLISGVSVAKTLSVALNLPIIAINHLIGHIYSLFLEREAEFGLGVLLVSGGHTMVLDIDESGKIEILATTGDDSFGESFDKVAKMMNLGYPGGAVIEQKALNGVSGAFEFTVPLKGDKRVEYSFSGLKNQVRVQIEKLGNLSEQEICDISLAFQKAACLHIIDKLKIIFKQKRFTKFGVVGGASANKFLRANLQKLCDNYNCQMLVAPLEFCSDNALMIARAGVEKYRKSEFTHYKELKINPKLHITKT